MKLAVENLDDFSGADRVRARLAEQGVERILVAVGSPGLGDLLMSVPLFRALKSGFPGAEVFFLGRLKPHTVSLFERIPHIDGLVEFDGYASSWGQRLDFLKRMRAERWDLLIDTQKKFLFSLYFSRFRARFKVGYSSDCLFSDVKFRAREVDAMHSTDKLLTLARVMGLEGDPGGELFFGPEHARAADSYLERWGIEPGSPGSIGLAPGAGVARRMWPVEYFAPAVRLLDQSLGQGSRFLVFGSSKEAELGLRIRDDLGPDYADRVRVPAHDAPEFDEALNMAALLSRCGAVFGSDGGVTHLASCAGVPVVAIYGPVHPDRFHPMNQPYRALFKDVGCFPCPDKRCGHSNCLRATAPEEAARAVLEVMAEKTEREGEL